MHPVRTCSTLLLSTAVLLSAAAVGTTSLSPTTVATGVATQVLVTSSITDEGVIASTVNLQRLDAAGRVVAVVGTLHDDGRDGDVTAGDKVYSLRVTVLENSPGPVPFRVSAGFAGSLTRSSPVLSA